MSPDTQQNILYAGYFLLAHNAVAIVYAIGALLCSAWALWEPRRSRILLMLGCLILLLAFQYDKHIQDPLIEQTRTSLITERQSYRLERVISLTLGRALPLALPLAGWSAVILGTVLELTHQKKRYNQRKKATDL